MILWNQQRSSTMRDEDRCILAKGFLKIFLKEMGSNRGAVREKLSIKEDLAPPQVEAIFRKLEAF